MPRVFNHPKSSRLSRDPNRILESGPSRLSRALWTGLVVALLVPAFAVAQPTDACDANTGLDGSDFFPFSGSVMNPANDFGAVGGAGCNSGGTEEIVLCFTPTSSCDVDITCSVSSNISQDVSANVNYFDGPCGIPASCHDSASSGLMNTNANVVLSATLAAGTEQCLMCGAGSLFGDIGSIGLAIVETSGSCGALPVALQQFSVDSD